MTGVSETAYAKINLALHVRRREPDGYHALETLFVFAEQGDLLTIEDEPGLRITGEFAPALGDGDNLVLQAERAFRARFGGAEAGFRLEKNLPVAAGIGGGSADAAAALRLLAVRAGVALDNSDLFDIAASLGADVPACLLSRTMRGEGRGDSLTSFDADALAGMPILLVNPRLPLSTGAVFARWDGIDRGPLAADDPFGGRNDLEPPARALLPEIDGVLTLLAAQPGIALARMSGSGATCLALFESDAARDAANHAIGAAEPGWWRLASRLRR